MKKIIYSTILNILPVTLYLVLGPCSYAQPGAKTDTSSPVDIQANEQEFAGDQIIAKGNVRVVYQDSVITGPEAVMQRDANGNPQTATFKGRPHLVQDKSVIDANTLSFDIANSRVIADGNAHSEVEQAEDPDKQAGGEKKSAKSGAKSQGSEKIITDADHQEYDRSIDKFEATGHVKVIHGDITVHAQKLQLVYGADKKPETAIFTGNVSAKQGQNDTDADTITYSLTTRRLQAQGHVKSKVVQPKKDEKKTGDASGGAASPQASAPVQSGAAYAAAAPGAGDPNAARPSGDEDPIIVTSNSQDNSDQTGRLTAEGNVRVYYQDMVGIGPKAILIKNADGKADHVYFIGRSQVSQTGRRWIADHITITCADKKVLAEGNTKAFIIQQGPKGPAGPPSGGNSQLAGRPSSSTNSISASKIEKPQ